MKGILPPSDGILEHGKSLIRDRHPELEPSDEDVFYYVYGIFHSPEYRTRYHNNLFREVARIPVVDQPDTFIALARIGRQLGNLHCRFENIDPWPLTMEWKTPPENVPPHLRYRCVKRMKWEGRMAKRDWTTLHFNEYLTLRDIPERAWQYRVGRDPVLKTVRNYQFRRRDRRTGLVSDGNEFSSNPRYTLDLFGKVIRVAMTTLDLMDRIPPLFEK